MTVELLWCPSWGIFSIFVWMLLWKLAMNISGKYFIVMSHLSTTEISAEEFMSEKLNVRDQIDLKSEALCLLVNLLNA